MFASPISGCYPGMRLKSGMIGIEPVGTPVITCTPSDEIFSSRGEIDVEDRYSANALNCSFSI